jgi:hypothetical protein
MFLHSWVNPNTNPFKSFSDRAGESGEPCHVETVRQGGLRFTRPALYKVPAHRHAANLRAARRFRQPRHRPNRIQAFVVTERQRRGLSVAATVRVRGSITMGVT